MNTKHAPNRLRRARLFSFSLLETERTRRLGAFEDASRFVVAGDICAPAFTLHPDDALYRAHELFRASGCPQIPVLEPGGDDEPDRILGMLDYRDMMRAYESELRRRREETS